MTELTPAQKVRLQLEKAQTQDVIKRAQRIKREQSAILPFFMGKDGKGHSLGQGDQPIAIATNLFYEAGTEMRSMPVRGGLSMVDNKPLIAPLDTTLAIPEPEIYAVAVQFDFNLADIIIKPIGEDPFSDSIFRPAFASTNTIYDSNGDFFAYEPPEVGDPPVAPTGDTSTFWSGFFSEGTIYLSINQPYERWVLTVSSDLEYIEFPHGLRMTFPNPNPVTESPLLAIDTTIRAYMGGILITETTQTFNSDGDESARLFPDQYTGGTELDFYIDLQIDSFVY